VEHETSWPVRFGAAVVVGFVLMGCGAGSPKLVGVPVKHPIGVIIKATPAVQAKSDRRGMRDLADVLLEGMKEKGLAGYVAQEGELVPPPRLELYITRWEATGEKRVSGYTAQLFVGIAATASAAVHAHDIELECSVVREGDATPADHHVYAGETGDAVARDILARVFTDQRVIHDPVPYERGRGGY
jgi:hypothetical protein